MNLKNCDIFLYTPTGTRNLLQHIHIDGLCNEFLQSLNAEIPECGEALGVCIFNCPFQFNMKAVDRMDSMEQLVFKYEDDSPSSPLCSARFEFDPDSEMTLEPKPLMSRIILESISNGLDKYRLLEEPVIYLGNAGSSARVFQEEEFRPKEVITKPGRIKLPHDIGFYTQYPETVLFCYPNDTPENILGQERTELLFECIIEGKSKCYTIGLPPIPRAATIKVDLIIDGEEKYYSHFS